MSTKTQALQDIDDIKEVLTLQTIRLGVGPANADRWLEKLARVETYIKTTKDTSAT